MTPILETTRRPDITLNQNGKIFITARVARMLSLSPGDSINIVCYDKEFLLFAKKNRIGRHKAQCYPTKKGSYNFCANSVRLVRKFFSICGIKDQRASFMVGVALNINDIVYCPIIAQYPL